MADGLIDIVSGVLLLTGGAFGIVGGLGLLRFPDFYTRLHAAGVTDTLCALLIVVGLALQSGFSLLTVKLALILLFLLFTAPTASHALARAAMTDDLEPETGDSARPEQGAPSSNT
ncbi:monovalent cation/H(+) antiporter subunit G [Wenzhouxiangella sp. EGI_FJ10409]|uniref:monovalent cation/H(+) antiporter subunit G n=1 Tax=Wenzhouxiangella sp. EGI_FJ10409 TaxID=3243767 RepID=UPI0035DF5E31